MAPRLNIIVPATSPTSLLPLLRSRLSAAKTARTTAREAFHQAKAAHKAHKTPKTKQALVAAREDLTRAKAVVEDLKGKEMACLADIGQGTGAEEEEEAEPPETPSAQGLDVAWRRDEREKEEKEKKRENEREEKKKKKKEQEQEPPRPRPHGFGLFGKPFDKGTHMAVGKRYTNCTRVGCQCDMLFDFRDVVVDEEPRRYTPGYRCRRQRVCVMGRGCFVRRQRRIVKSEA